MFREHAPLYWSAGLPVMPVRGKAAFLTGWQNYSDAMPTEAERRVWLAAHASMNLGLPLGPASGLFMIDIDTTDPELMKKIEAELPPSPWRRFGSKGAALAYRYSQDIKNFKIKGADGAMIVEGLGRKQQIVCPPSIHPDTGNPYTSDTNLWEVLNQLQELPTDIASRLRRTLGVDNEARSASNTIRAGGKIAKGGRHDALTSEAGRMRNAGLTGPVLGAALHMFNEINCDPPVEERQVDAIVRSATEVWQGGDGLPFTQLGHARRLVDRLGGTGRYITERKRWYFWNKVSWAPDFDLRIEREAKALTDDLLHPKNSDAKRKAGLAAQSKNVLRAMIDLAQSEPGIPVSANLFDASPDTLNTPSGVVELRTATLRPGQPEEYHSKTTAVGYDQQAECPLFLKFLNDVLLDPQLVAFVQRWAGYCLTGDTSEHRFLVASGAGRNGKSTLFNVLKKAFGDYAVNTHMNTFLRRPQGGPNNDLAALNGARLVLANEGNPGQPLDTASMKAMTGGDPVTARFLFKEFETFTPGFKPVLISNHIPEMDATDPAIWARLLIVPFTRVFLDDEKDPKLPEKLEAEMSGILRWAVEGARAWYSEGLNPPLAVTGAVQMFFSEMDMIGAFVSERCTAAPGLEARSNVLYMDFEHFARDLGLPVPSSTMFGRELTKRGYPARKTNGTKVRTGLALRAGVG